MNETILFGRHRTPEGARILEDEEVEIYSVLYPSKKIAKVPVTIKGSKAETPSGFFWLPKPGSKSGKYYLVHVLDRDEHVLIQFCIPSLNEFAIVKDFVFIRSIFVPDTERAIWNIPSFEQTTRLPDVYWSTIWVPKLPLAIPMEAIFR